MTNHNASVRNNAPLTGRFMAHLFGRYGWGLLLLGMVGCRSAQNLNLQTLPNYSPAQPTIVFLDFMFQSTDNPERSEVQLANAITARGPMKDLPVFSNSDRQVEVVFRNAANEPIRTVQYDHPLYRIVEVPNDDGTLRLRGFSMKKSNLSIRFNYQPEPGGTARIDLYSLIKNRRTKLYSVRLNL